MSEKVVLCALEAYVRALGGDVGPNLAFARALVRNGNIEWRHLQFKEGKLVGVAGLKLINGKMLFGQGKRHPARRAPTSPIPEKAAEVERVKNTILC